MKKVYWEPEAVDEVTNRVKVIGGWIVTINILTVKGVIGATSTFVPDQNHEWYPLKREALPKEPERVVPDLLKTSVKAQG
jgi:hypothetical protein